VQVPPAVRGAQGIGRPNHRVDAERLEQAAAGVLERARPRRLGDDPGEQVHAAAAVLEPAAGVGGHRQIEHELDPVGAVLHLAEGDLAGSEATIQTGRHGQQVLDGEVFLARATVGDAAPREQRQDRLIDPTQQALADRDPDQRGRHALGGRREVVRIPGAVREETRVEDDSAVAHDEQTTDRDPALANEIEQSGENARVHSLRFRSGTRPSMRRPGHRLAVSAADRQPQERFRSVPVLPMGAVFGYSSGL